jgi:Tfp pilus assembly protein PilZ
MDEPIKHAEKTSLLTRLTALIEKLPYGEQYALLNELEEKFSRLNREHTRKSINTNVECVTGNRTNKGLITNISAGGVFIETIMPFRCGEDIVLKFMFPQNPPKQLKLVGQIVRISPFGVGVRFKPLSKNQELFITSLLKANSTTLASLAS